MTTAKSYTRKMAATRKQYRDWRARHDQHRLKAVCPSVTDLYMLGEGMSSSYSVPCRFMHDRHGIMLLGPGALYGFKREMRIPYSQYPDLPEDLRLNFASGLRGAVTKAARLREGNPRSKWMTMHEAAMFEGMLAERTLRAAFLDAFGRQAGGLEVTFREQRDLGYAIAEQAELLKDDVDRIVFDGEVPGVPTFAKMAEAWTRFGREYIAERERAIDTEIVPDGIVSLHSGPDLRNAG